jgi:hypothetical protein
MNQTKEYKNNFQRTKKDRKKIQRQRRARLPRKAKKKTMLRKLDMKQSTSNMRMLNDGLPLKVIKGLEKYRQITTQFQQMTFNIGQNFDVDSITDDIIAFPENKQIIRRANNIGTKKFKC